VLLKPADAQFLEQVRGNRNAAGCDDHFLNSKEWKLIQDRLVFSNDKPLAFLSEIQSVAGEDQLRHVVGLHDGDAFVEDRLIIRYGFRYIDP
jgi:hypothetical protein